LSDEPERNERKAAAAKGAKYGLVAGLLISQAIIGLNSPLGFYTGSLVLVFGFWLGIGAAIGAAIGWWAAGHA
jgi:hypothetical protein